MLSVLNTVNDWGRSLNIQLVSKALIHFGLWCLVSASLAGAEVAYRPNLDRKLVELQPPQHWGKFVVPVSVHLGCEDKVGCAQRTGAIYSEAYFSRLLAIMSQDYQPPTSSFFFR